MIARGPCRTDISGRSDRGLVRPENEDCYLTAELALRHPGTDLPEGREHAARESVGKVLIVADGMGGHAAGGEASRLATEAFLGALLERAAKCLAEGSRPLRKEMRGILSSCLFECHRKILAAADQDPRLYGMGTTLTAAVLLGNELFTAHVGDSRCSVLRNGELMQLTHDHTVAQWCRDHDYVPVDEGAGPEEGADSPMGHILWNVLGGRSGGMVPEVRCTHVVLGDIVLLCTDGLTRQVSAREIIEILGGEDLEAATQELVDAANRAGGVDNVTVLAARVGSECESAEGARGAWEHRR